MMNCERCGTEDQDIFETYNRFSKTEELICPKCIIKYGGTKK